MKFFARLLALQWLLCGVCLGEAEQELSNIRVPSTNWEVTTVIPRTTAFPGLVAVLGDWIYFSDWKGDQGHCRGQMLYRISLKNVGEGEKDVADLNCITGMFVYGEDLYVAYDGKNDRSGVRKFRTDGQVDAQFALRFAESLYEWDRFGEALKITVEENNGWRKSNWTISDGIQYRVKWLKGKESTLLIQKWALNDAAPGEIWLQPFSVGDNLDRFYSEMFLKKTELGEIVVVGDTLFASVEDTSPDSELLGQITTINLKERSAGPVLGNLTKGPSEPRWEKRTLSEWSGRRFRYLVKRNFGLLIPDLTDFADEVASVAYFQPGSKEIYRLNIDSRGMGGLFYSNGEYYLSRPNIRQILKFSPKTN